MKRGFFFFFFGVFAIWLFCYAMLFVQTEPGHNILRTNERTAVYMYVCLDYTRRGDKEQGDGERARERRRYTACSRFVLRAPLSFRFRLLASRT